MMKKIASLVLALCLICLSVSVLAEAAAIPQTYNELPAAVVVEDVSEFYGTWQARYAASDGNILSLEDAASGFGGNLPVIVIDAETISSSVGEGEDATAESHEYDYDEEFSQITVVDPETGEVGLVVDLLEDGSIEVMFIQGETAFSLFMVKVAAGTEG